MISITPEFDSWQNMNLLVLGSNFIAKVNLMRARVLCLRFL